MPRLDIGVVLVEPDFEALIPTVKFKVQVKNAAPHEPIRSCLLRALEKEYEFGRISKEKYEELKKKYEEKLKSI